MKNTRLYLKIKVKSFHKYYLNRFIVLVEENIKANMLNLNSHVFLPNQIERFTVLTSPHVDKKAREQFERRIYKSILLIDVTDYEKNWMLFKLIRLFSILSIGVSFKIVYEKKTS